MKTSPLFHALWALVALVAFLAGRVANDPASKAIALEVSGGATKSAVSEAKESETAADGAGEGATSPTEVALTSEQARVQTFELLSVPDRLKRLTRLCEMLRRMTRENWRDINMAFEKQTEFTGRTHSEEWHLMLDRVGEVAGVEAVEETLVDGKNRAQLSWIAAGWAAGDPQAAMKWLEAQPPERQEELASSFVSGLARSDPATALSYIGTRMPEARDQLMRDVVNGLIQQSGFQHAEEMLPGLRTRSDIPDPVKGSFYWQPADRQIRMARLRNDPKAVLAWADRTAGVSLAGPAALKDMVSYVAETDAPGAFEWVVDRSLQWHPDQIARVFPAIGAAYHQKAPEQFAAWIDAHPDHPQRDVLATAVAQSVLNFGDFDAALRWAETLSPGDARSKLEARIAERREKAVAVPPTR